MKEMTNDQWQTIMSPDVDIDVYAGDHPVLPLGVPHSPLDYLYTPLFCL